MSSLKESLHDTIETLSDEEARQTLEFIQRLRKRSRISISLARLAGDPAFKVPSEERVIFRLVNPVKGKGIPASRLLVEERR